MNPGARYLACFLSVARRFSRDSHALTSGGLPRRFNGASSPAGHDQRAGCSFTLSWRAGDCQKEKQGSRANRGFGDGGIGGAVFSHAPSQASGLRAAMATQPSCSSTSMTSKPCSCRPESTASCLAVIMPEQMNTPFSFRTASHPAAGQGLPRPECWRSPRRSADPPHPRGWLWTG
jgi:hypothetical protein